MLPKTYSPTVVEWIPTAVVTRTSHSASSRPVARRPSIPPPATWNQQRFGANSRQLSGIQYEQRTSASGSLDKSPSFVIKHSTSACAAARNSSRSVVENGYVLNMLNFCVIKRASAFHTLSSLDLYNTTKGAQSIGARHRNGDRKGQYRPNNEFVV